MRSSHSSPEPGRAFEEHFEIERLKLDLELGNQVLRGERVFGDSIQKSLSRDLADADAAGIALGDLRLMAEKLLQQLPQAEINNCKAQARKFVRAGDTVNEALWNAEASRRESALGN
ncbi:MAG: hypothetical protein P4L57_02325 [Rhizomicrobium sp.]|nr:hypothetical protein [Rhizomicrobium sp.]